MKAERILVVEDERIIALHLRQQLTKLGYDVPNTVSSGDHALRRIEESQPDLVLMDINLKGKLDGIATAAAIRQSYVIPIIYLTAYSADEMLARAAATNPQGYLLKPFSERELHAMIQVTLARCRNERASIAAQERLQQSRKMEALGQLAGGIADEVDDLLSALYDQLEILGRHVIGEPMLYEPIQQTFRKAIEKEQLIRRLLEFCGRWKATPSTISVHDQLARVSDRLRQILGNAIAVQVVVPDDLWQARIDPTRLAHTLANLTANARAAMPHGGSLTIAAQNTLIDQEPLDVGLLAGRYVVLSVTDTGTGMPQDVIDRVFDPFFTTRADGDSCGLGLSLVFGFIRQSGGHISIDSKPGNGTTVRIYLPAATGDDLADTTSAAKEWPLAARVDPQGDLAIKTSEDTVRNSTAEPRIHQRDHQVSATQRQSGQSPVLWRRAENAMFASVPGRLGQVPSRLIVEPLPRQNGWDWTVWWSGNDGQKSRYGRATSIVSAMAAAEDAASHWATSEHSGD